MLLAEPRRGRSRSPTSSSAAAAKIRSPAGSKPSRASEAIATALGGDLALHVERAAAPDARRRAARPTTGRPATRPASASTVSVCESSSRLGPSPRPGIRATRFARSGVRAYELALDAVPGEVVAQQLGRLRLVPGRIDRVEPDQLLQELRDLVAEVHASALASTRRQPPPEHTSGVSDLFADAARERLQDGGAAGAAACARARSTSSSARSRCSASARRCGSRSRRTASARRSSTGRREPARRRSRGSSPRRRAPPSRSSRRCRRRSRTCAR